MTNPSMLVNVCGTELLASDTREQYRQKLARITLDSMVQFVGLLDAKGTVLEINHVALDAVGIKLSDVEGRPFWTTFWWQVSEEINATLRDSSRREELAKLDELKAQFLTAQFETLLNQAPLGIYMVDADFKIREVNPVALPLFGELRDSVLGRDFREK